MKIAIIGAGLAGLATAHFLLETNLCMVTLFDAKGVGGGASSTCSGLLHPYPGLNVRRSSYAKEALLISKQLIHIAEAHTPEFVATQGGILREARNIEQKQKMIEHTSKWGDVQQLMDSLFLIHSGITVHTENYLRGLFNACEKRGAKLLLQNIEDLEELKNFDHIVIAAGYGVRHFPECTHLKVNFVKGQALRLSGIPPFAKSYISKGYIAKHGQEKFFELGSTYERTFNHDKPDLETAKKLLEENLKTHCSEAKILSCKAGVRVTNQTHYLPIVEKVADNAHVYTALGSRGLLYHGFFARKLSQAILSNNPILS